MVDREKYRLLDKRKKMLRQNATLSELKIKEKLKLCNIRAMFQKGFILGKNFCIVDFYIPKYRLVLEIDGEYHNTIKQKARDENRDYYLSKQRKRTVLHLTNDFADSLSVEQLTSLIGRYGLRNRNVTYLNSMQEIKKEPPVLYPHNYPKHPTPDSVDAPF